MLRKVILTGLSRVNLWKSNRNLKTLLPHLCPQIIFTIGIVIGITWKITLPCLPVIHIQQNNIKHLTHGQHSPDCWILLHYGNDYQVKVHKKEIVSQNPLDFMQTLRVLFSFAVLGPQLKAALPLSCISSSFCLSFGDRISLNCPGEIPA